MLKRITTILSLFAITIIFFSCHKKTESITGFNVDTTGGLIVRKPNIYIYPSDKIDLTITLNFPKGGKILESIPDYQNEWNVTVDPSGKINDQYNFLFYEAQIPPLLQKEYGWIISGKNLEQFFTQNLNSLLFSEKEISDFIEYWIPILDWDRSYVIYPHFNQELSEILDLKLSINPDNLIRVIYSIEKYQGSENIKTPEIPAYRREGFTVLEWGIISNTSAHE
jgi:hypothetical protein